MPKNLIQHVEWTTRDTERLKTFFASIFDWKFSQAMPDYTLIEGVGGIFQAPDPNMPISVTPYVNVADLAETEAKITAAGGTIYKSKEEVPGRGWFTIFGDPDGNPVAIWQSIAPRTVAKRATAKKAAKAKPKPKAKKRAKR